MYFLGFLIFGAHGSPSPITPVTPVSKRGVPRKQTWRSELLIFPEEFNDFHVPCFRCLPKDMINHIFVNKINLINWDSDLSLRP